MTAMPAPPQSFLMEDTLIPDSPNHQTLDMPSSSSSIPYIYTSYMSHNPPGPSTVMPMSHNAPFMSHNAHSPNTLDMSHRTLFAPYLPYHTYTHIDSQGQMPFN